LILQPKAIADAFTLIQIDAQIVDILAAITNATAAKSDSFDDMQARQKSERQNITELNKTLAAWITAKNIKTGADSSTADISPVNYNPSVNRI